MLFPYSGVICISLVLNKATPRREIRLFCSVFVASSSSQQSQHLSLFLLSFGCFSSGLPRLRLAVAVDRSERLSNLRIFSIPMQITPPRLSLIIPASPPLPPLTVACNQSKRQLKLKGKRSLLRWMEGLNINRMRLT